MLDRVPVQFWLLILIGFVAYSPAAYVYRHIVHAPSRHDVTQPKVDLTWRTPAKFALNVMLILLLAGLAVFIFTPAAAEFARSPSFLPSLMAVGAAFCWFEVVQGLLKGETEPLLKGGLGPYRRSDQPVRYWGSMILNILVAFLVAYFTFKT